MAKKLHIRTAKEAFEEQLAADPLRDFHVLWDDITKKQVDGLRRSIARAKVEADMQRFLQKNPQMLIQHLGGGHGRWVVPQARLGSQHVPDFIIGDRDSSGRDWTAVELEGPQRPVFNKSGGPSRWVWHAVRQIIDWRVWLEFNRDYATRPPSEGGLGLEDISPALPGLIIIGRRTTVDETRKAFRRVLSRQLDIQIHTYDWLVDRAAGRVSSLKAWRRSRERSDRDGA